MRKQKNKQILVKVLIAVFILNTFAFFNFATPASAVGGELNVNANPNEVYKGHQIEITWNSYDAYYNTPMGVYRVGGFTFEIYVRIDGGTWSLEHTTQGRSYTYTTETNGATQFRVVEYASWRELDGDRVYYDEPFEVIGENSKIVTVYNYEEIDGIIDINNPIDNYLYERFERGYYQATYGFECGDYTKFSNGGVIHEDLTSIIDEKVGHRSVLVLESDSEHIRNGAYHDFSGNMDSGTLEFWWYISPNGETGRSRICFKNGLATIGFIQHIPYQYNPEEEDGALYWYKNEDSLKIPISRDFIGNSWIHINIDWSGSDVVISVNNDFPVSVSFNGGYNSPNSLCLEVYGGADCYLDAYGDSFDPNYNIGDNLIQGFLIDYSIHPDIETLPQFYRLNGGPDIEINGDFIIPFLNTNTHEIEIIARDEIQFIEYTSGIVTFYIQNKISFLPPVDGNMVPHPYYHPGTYGFEDEENGIQGMAIDFLNNYHGGGENSGTDISVVRNADALDNHMDYLCMRDHQDSDNTYGVHNIENPQTRGTIEFYHRFKWDDESSPHAEQKLLLSDIFGIPIFILKLTFESNIGKYTFNGIDLNFDVQPSVWYHHSIVFDCNNPFDLEIAIWTLSDANGVVKGSVASVVPNWFDRIYKIKLITSIDDFGFSTYYDEFGFSWDPLYNVGDNMNYLGIPIEIENEIEIGLTKISCQYDDSIGDIFTGDEIFGNNIILPGDATDHQIRIIGEGTDSYLYISDLVDYHAVGSVGD